MTIDKDAENERILKYRHDQECKLLAELILKKEEEQKELVAGQAAYEKEYMGHKELQDAINETKKLRDEIEQMKVQI